MFRKLGMFDRSLGMFQPPGSIPFQPGQLFLAGEQGVWYDPSDFSTMFQDAAGTNPVTAIEQPVGRILDKSGRGNHASQSTTTARPILRNRYNLLVQTATLSTQNVTTRATSHKLSFSGAGTITLSGTATGTFSAGTNTFTATAGTLTLTVSGTVTEAMLTEANDGNVPYQWVTTGGAAGYDTDTTKFPPYLFFDGSDDWLSTANINFSATDRMSVFAGARRLSNTAYPIVCELSSQWDTNNSTFAVAGGAINANSWYFGLNGTTLINYEPTTYTPPITNVLSSLMDISQSEKSTELVPRINGIVKQSGGAGTTAGTGNFGTYPIYIGARFGTTTRSLFFFGRIYSLIIRGALTSSPQLGQTERWVAGKTGVTL